MRGIVIGQEGVDVALVRLASEREIADLLAAPAVAIAPRHERPMAGFQDIVGEEIYVVRQNAYVVVGYVTELRVQQERLDVSTYSDPGRHIAGLARARGEFEARPW